MNDLSFSGWEFEDMAGVPTNVVNLDALIRRADLAAPGEIGSDLTALSVSGLEKRGWLYPALRKPDFQRETASWTPDQVADLVATFARRDLIPAVILWRAGQDVFVIDGAHRLSALMAWVLDDYGAGELSRRFFHDVIPDDQKKAAERAKELVNLAVGSYADHMIARDFPDNARADIAERAPRIGWQEIPAQWITSPDHEKAEKAFFRINQGGTKIDATERRILASRSSATALAARAILRGGTGHGYWAKFDGETKTKIEDLGRDIHRLLFEPQIALPIRTLDLPLAGKGYGPQSLPFVFDLVNQVNRVLAKDSSHKGPLADQDLKEDKDGQTTVAYLVKVKTATQRICSNDPSSLGLHPVLYFYSKTGTFSSTSLLTFMFLVRDWTTEDFLSFSEIRAEFEGFLLVNRGITEAIRKLGSGLRSRPRAVSFYKEIIALLKQGKDAKDTAEELKRRSDFAFLISDLDLSPLMPIIGAPFNREIKGAAYIKDFLPTAAKCPTCNGLMHSNGMQVGHKRARRDGGTGDLVNAGMQHPFCNSTVAN